MAKPATNLLGRTFGRLYVTERANNSKAGAACWRVVCVCGVTKTVRSSQLTSGGTSSCGCLAKELARKRAATHGRAASFEYKAWTSMRKRCEYEKHPAYARYGGAGIRVSAAWHVFENFFADMGPCPFANGSVDRKDNSKGYSKENCRWLPKAQQSKNRRNVPLYDGLTLPELAERRGVKYATLKRRLAAGWSSDRLFKTPQQLGTRK